MQRAFPAFGPGLRFPSVESTPLPHSCARLPTVAPCHYPSPANTIALDAFVIQQASLNIRPRLARPSPLGVSAVAASKGIPRYCSCLSFPARLSSSPLSIAIHKSSSIYLPLLSSYLLLPGLLV
jgi:hypothetical protein